MQSTFVSYLFAFAGSAVAVSQVAGQSRLEFTEDGRELPVIVSAVENVGWSAREGAPFGAAADWSLNLRRQVGSVRIADLNGDGINDLAVGCYISNSFPPYDNWYDMIFFGTGLPGAAALPTQPSWIAADQMHTGDLQVGDVDLDGKVDLVAITGGTAFSPPRVYFSQAGAGVGPSNSPGWIAAPPTSGWATGGLLVDIDNDGDLDLMTTNQGVSPNAFRPMYLFRNNAGALGAGPAWQSAESSIQNTLDAIDVNGDGFPDIAVSKWVNFESGIYSNLSGTPATVPSWTVGSTEADRGVAVGDVNGDGVADVAFGGPNGTRLYHNIGGVLTLVYTSTPPFNSVQEILLEDVDLDGDLDLLEVHFSDGRTHVYLNSGGVLAGTPSWTFDATQVANAIAVGDLNGDGLPDLAVGYSGDVSVRIFFGKSTTTPCYANCDGSTTNPVVNVTDFSCFLQKFAAGDPYANCDGSTIEPVLNVADFSCYLGKFAAGCR